MAVTIDGDGTITGVSVGGLPDGIVDTDMLAADAVTSAKIGSKTFTSYALLTDSKINNTDGGTFTTGAWRTRDITKEDSDPDGIVSISSNQFTLGAGSYLIKFSAPAYQADTHQTRLYDVTGAAAVALGSTEFTSSATTNGTNRSFGVARITISANNVYEIQHRGSASRSTFGFGVGSSGGMDWGSATPGTVYTIVEIYKEA